MKEGREEGNKQQERGREGRTEAEDYLLSLEASAPRTWRCLAASPPGEQHPDGAGTRSCSGPAGSLGMAVTFLSVRFPVWKRGQSSPCGRVRGSPT